MSRHIIDHRTAPEAARKRNFWALEWRNGSDGPHPAVRALHERPAERDSARKVAEFLRIDRGRTT